MTRSNLTISIDAAILEQTRALLKEKPHGYLSSYIEQGLIELIEEEGGKK